MLSLNVLADKSEREKTDLSALLYSTAELLRLLLSRNGNTLQTEISDGRCVFGSVDLLSQVVMNLLQNSNNHTSGGCIRLSASASSGEINVEVSDNGSGISAEMLPHVFERGVTDGGTGVGLFLCKTVVESHGGTIGNEAVNNGESGNFDTLATFVFSVKYNIAIIISLRQHRTIHIFVEIKGV